MLSSSMSAMQSGGEAGRRAEEGGRWWWRGVNNASRLPRASILLHVIATRFYIRRPFLLDAFVDSAHSNQHSWSQRKFIQSFPSRE